MPAATRPSRGILIAAWIFPVMVLTGFAFLGGIPVLVVLVKAIRQHTLRLWAALLTTAYAVPVALWQLGPSDAPSLTKYLSPLMTYLLAAAGITVALAATAVRRRSWS
ncbi:hypothetical protein GCM10029976_073990 [Kribbella albertanoniae]|uniref:Uncharacterized protein n=1 Tax=Kribbella albertanoniae TaxID=1266829 RepID=A0A4R4P4R1_9ACTN|nr:hypothetical protein [Kribbella albertanoniae]TDC15763.1 hypothetical protein E1261_40040 [Kribbella albertanoniae]